MINTHIKTMSNLSNNILQIGHVLNDKWVIIDFIGKGAMGEVYRAHQLNLKRDVAIKIISQDMLQSFEEDSKEIEGALQRFRREVQAMAQVRHPNVLQIMDYGSDAIFKDGKDVPIDYIVMEYIPGATLRFTMSEEGFYPEQDLIASWLTEYFLPLLEGVEAIHARKIVHRDLKPENVLLDENTPKIADFGLACSVCMKPVTQSIDVKGTPGYMSPEHFFDFKKADRKSDIYSLGKILCEAIEGKMTSKILPFKRAAIANPNTPFLQKLNQIIQNATAEEKSKRIESVGDLRSALLEALDILKNKTMLDASVYAKPFSLLHRPLFIWTGIIIAILSMTLMALWHLMGDPWKTSMALKTKQKMSAEFSQTGSSGHSEIAPTSPASSVLGKDGNPMLFVPGGELDIVAEDSNDQQHTIRIQPFYMDKNMVTNHHFAEFLNEVKAGLFVENGVVKKNGETWFYLGKGTEPFEQIIYKHGRFHLRDVTYAAYPVVRVTWFGALAYARYYDKRLLTESEWDYLFSKQRLSSMVVSEENTYIQTVDTPDTSPSLETHTPMMGETHTHMMHMDTTSGDDRASVNQPSGQHVPGNIPARSVTNNVSDFNSIKEWAIRDDANQKERSEAEFQENIDYPSLIINKSFANELESKSFRYPWEAFPDVGFRCVFTLGND